MTTRNEPCRIPRGTDLLPRCDKAKPRRKSIPSLEKFGGPAEMLSPEAVAMPVRLVPDPPADIVPALDLKQREGIDRRAAFAMNRAAILHFVHSAEIGAQIGRGVLRRRRTGGKQARMAGHARPPRRSAAHGSAAAAAATGGVRRSTPGRAADLHVGRSVPGNRSAAPRLAE